MHQLLAQSDSTGFQESLTVISTALSVGLLLFALSKARQRIPLRPILDVVRLAVQVTGVMLMAALSGVQTPLGAVAGAVMVGAAVGFLQGRELQFEFEEGRLWFRRSAFGVLIWGSGLVMMQVAGLANRAGVVRIGQVIAWFSIGVTLGVIVGRQGGVDRTRAAAAATAGALALGTLGFSVAMQSTDEAQAQSDDEGPDLGATLIAACQAGGNTTPSFGTDCEAAWVVFSQGADECFDSEFAGSRCQRYYDAILMMGQADLAMLACESPYSQVPSCLGSTPPPPDPEPEPAPQPEPQPGQDPEPPPPPAPPAPPPPSSTIIVTEDIDPDAPPPVAVIPDEGDSLVSPPPVQPNEGGGGSSSGSGGSSGGSGSGGSSGGGESSGGSSSGSSGSSDDTSTIETEEEDTSSPTPLPEDDGSGETALSPLPPQVEDDEDTVTSDEALEQAIAGLLAAALIGLITWAEAFAAIDALSGSASGTAEGRYGHLQQQFPDTGPSPSNAGGNPPGGGGPTTPVDSYLPGSTTTAPPGGTPSGGPGAGEPSWVPQGGAGAPVGGGGPTGSGSGPTSGGTTLPGWVPDGFEDEAGAGGGSGETGSTGGPATPSEPSWVPGGTEGSSTPGGGGGPSSGGLDHGPTATPPFGDDTSAPGAGEGSGSSAGGGQDGDTGTHVPDWMLDHGEPAPFTGDESGDAAGTGDATGGTPDEEAAGATPGADAPPDVGDAEAGVDGEPGLDESPTGSDGDTGAPAGPDTVIDPEDGTTGPALTDLGDLLGESGDQGPAPADLSDLTGEGSEVGDATPAEHDAESTDGDPTAANDEDPAPTGSLGDESGAGDDPSAQSELDEGDRAAGDGDGDDDGDESGSGSGIEDWVLGQVEEQQLDPNGAPTRETAGPMGAANSRLTDRDGDGRWDHVEYDDDHDGIYDRTEVLDQPIDPDGSTPVPPDDPAPSQPDEPGPSPSGTSGSPESTDDAEPPAEEPPIEEPELPEEPEVPEEPEMEVPDEPAPLSRQEIDDAWRWGLANGRSVDDIREDLDGLSQARGVDGPVDDPYGIRPRPTANGDVPLTAGEAAHYADLQQQLDVLDTQRADLDARWQELLDARRRWTSRELNVDLRRMARALEVYELNGTFDDRIAAEQEWIRVLKMWRAGDTWADGPDGSSFYDHSYPDRRSFDAEIAQRTARIGEIDQERVAAMEEARDSRVTTERLDDLDRLQDDLLARRRAVDTQADSIRGELDRYEAFGTSRPLPER